MGRQGRGGGDEYARKVGEEENEEYAWEEEKEGKSQDE